MKLSDPHAEYAVPQPQSETETLLIQLHHAALNWYKTQNLEYMQQYQNLYHLRRPQGWNGSIDIIVELPDALVVLQEVFPR